MSVETAEDSLLGILQNKKQIHGWVILVMWGGGIASSQIKLWSLQL